MFCSDRGCAPAAVKAVKAANDDGSNLNVTVKSLRLTLVVPFKLMFNDDPLEWMLGGCDMSIEKSDHRSLSAAELTSGKIRWTNRLFRKSLKSIRTR